MGEGGRDIGGQNDAESSLLVYKLQPVSVTYSDKCHKDHSDMGYDGGISQYYEYNLLFNMQEYNKEQYLQNLI